MKILIVKYPYIAEGLEEELLKRGHEIISKRLISDEDIKKYDVFITWNETLIGGARELVGIAKTLGKKVILLQHGAFDNSKFRMSPPFNENLLSDVICVWGEEDKRKLIECGVEENRIAVTGTTIFKHLKPRVPHKNKTILFVAEHGDEDTEENLCIAGTIRKLKVDVITKLLIPTDNNLEWYDNPVVSDRYGKDHLDIFANILSKVDVVVSLSESTSGLMAEAMDIPVVCADVWIPKAYHGDERYLDFKRVYSKACTKVKIDKLNTAIKYAFKHPEHLREERREVVAENGGNIKDPIEKLIKVIEDD